MNYGNKTRLYKLVVCNCVLGGISITAMTGAWLKSSSYKSPNGLYVFVKNNK